MSASDNTPALSPEATIIAEILRLCKPTMFPELPEASLPPTMTPEVCEPTPAPSMFPELPAPASELDPNYYNDCVVKACEDDDLEALEALFRDHGLSIRPAHANSKAWKIGVRQLSRPICELFMKYYGHQFYYDDKSLRDACAADDRETAMFLYSLIEDRQPFADDDAIEMASRHGNQEFVMKVLNNWVFNVYSDLTCMCIAAMLGCIYGDHEELFDLVLGKYMTHIRTVTHGRYELNGTLTPTHINRFILIRIANSRSYKYFNKALNKLDVSISRILSGEDIYANVTKTSGYVQHDGARRALFSECCDNRDSMIIDALIEKYGEGLFLGYEKRIDTGSKDRKYFETACKYGHASAVRLIAQYHGITAALPLFKICIKENKPDLCAIFIDLFGSKFVSEIETEAGLDQNPIVRSVLRSFYKKKYEHYSRAI